MSPHHFGLRVRPRRDGRFVRPEIAGVDSILAGWSTLSLPDPEIERLGFHLFEGLYGALSISREAPAGEPGPERPARRGRTRKPK